MRANLNALAVLLRLARACAEKDRGQPEKGENKKFADATIMAFSGRIHFALGLVEQIFETLARGDGPFDWAKRIALVLRDKCNAHHVRNLKMIRGPRHENILAEREQIVNVSFHVGPNGCGLAS